jgi:type IV pilus assembly protein PilQ
MRTDCPAQATNDPDSAHAVSQIAVSCIARRWSRSGAIDGALILVLLVGITGCRSRPLPHRPTIDDLVQTSLDNAPPQYNIESVDAPATWADQVPLLPGETIMDVQTTDDLGSSTGLQGVIVTPADVTQTAFAEDQYLGDDVSEVTFDEEFIETDVREVLLTLSEEAKIDVVMDEKVRGVVNARLDKLTFDQAADKILLPLGLHGARQGKQYYVAPADPESPLFSYISQRIEYRPKHLDTATLIETVPTSLKPFVQEINGSNLIVVEAPSRIARQLIDKFAGIDQPIPQVILEAIICVVSPDSGFQFGLDWSHAVELNGANALRFGASGLAMSSTYSRAGANAIFDDFAKTSTFIKLLNEHGYLTIRATPHVMAQDGKQASIAINRETFFSVQPQTNNNGDNSAFFFQQDIQTVQAGISLDITPRIRGDIVTIEIEKAEVSEDVRNANTELSVNPFPIINRRSVSTTVHVKDGKTIVIGGLVQQETIDKVNRIPGLSSIPLLGYLFETTQRQTRDAEVVIFISPKIVAPANHCP